MNCEAIRWALEQRIRPAVKLLLVTMAAETNPQDSEPRCWLPLDELARRTMLDIKTARLGLAWLQSHGFVELAGRAGRTSQAAIYCLKPPKNGRLSVTETAEVNVTGPPAKPPKNGGVPAETLPKTGGFNPPKNGRLSAAKPPKNGRLSEELFPLEPLSSTLNEPGCSSQTPIPNTGSSGKGERKRAVTLPDRPNDVTEQTWDDWLQLRKQKKAPVTETVLKHARKEAGKADMPLEAFLVVWCGRGSQGLDAAWLTKDERTGWRGAAANGDPLPPWRREQRTRMQQFAPGVAVRDAMSPPLPVHATDFFNAIDAEVKRVK